MKECLDSDEEVSRPVWGNIWAYWRDRSMFRVQMLATLVSGLVSIAVMEFQLSSVDHMCDVKYQTSHERFTCPSETIFFSASVIWAVVGPKKIFDSQYPIMRWCFLIGFAVAIFFVVLQKFVPRLLKKMISKEVHWLAQYEVEDDTGVDTVAW